MKSKQRLRKQRQSMCNTRYINALVEQHIDTEGNVDFVALNRQLHDETNNPTMEEYFGIEIEE